jgi:hypothetical protein
MAVDIEKMIAGNKHYETLVADAEKEFYSEKYLNAFLLQSCIIEGVLKNYFKHCFGSQLTTKRLLDKVDRMEMSAMADTLLLANRLTKQTYDQLTEYREKRNEVIHRLLDQTDSAKLKAELKKAFELGRATKGFIVETMTKEKDGVAAEDYLAQVIALQEQLAELGGPDLNTKFLELLQKKKTK